MDETTEKDPKGCPGHCPEYITSRDSGDPVCVTDGPLKGWRFAFSAIMTFLLPLALALTGAYLAKDDKDRQVLFVVGGLIIGVSIAYIFRKFVNFVLPK